MFANRIKLLRNGKGLTQVEFAKAFNIATGTIAMWETGKRQPDYVTLAKLAVFFNVSTDYLLGCTDEKTHPSKKDGCAVIRYDSEKLNELMAVISALPESEQEKLLDFAKFQSARLDKLKGK